MRILGLLLCLIALGLTGYSALTYQIPQIEADIEGRTARVLAAMDSDDVQLRVDGRHVMLEGRVEDEQERRNILRVVAAVPGVLGPIDILESQPPASPYRFDAVKSEDGVVSLEGHVPSQEAKTIIETDAMALFGDDMRIALEVVDGAPSEDWPLAAGTALDALATIRHGKLSIADTLIALEGEVADETDIDAINIFADLMPDGYRWEDDLSVRRKTVTPFTFSVVKNADAGLFLSGYAPDEATRDALIEEGKAIGGDKPVVANIEVADGMPDQEWPSLVQAGISAMRDMESGRFEVVDNDVSFTSDNLTSPLEDPSGETAPDRELAALEPVPSETLDQAETASLEPSAAPADSAPRDPSLSGSEPSIDAALAPAVVGADALPFSLTVDKAEEGAWSIRGAVPDRETRDVLVRTLEDHAGVDEVDVELELTGGAFDEAWLRFISDHIPTLDVVRAGRLHLEEDEAHLIGVVDTPEDIEPVGQALAAIDETMTVDLQPIDPRPLAALELTLSSEDGVVLNGTLPGGLSEGEALLALGLKRYAGELGENGRGQAEVWRRDLAAIGAFLPAFEELGLTLDDERPRIKGRIDAVGDADALARDIVLALSEDRQPLVDIEASSTARGEGDRRKNPLTGEEEAYRRGFWLPVMDIVADTAACRDRAAAMLASDKITFLRGDDALDQRAETTLNALASLAHVCLENTDLVLEIGGHTDSRGAASLNEQLSQARAEAVLDALKARGVAADALIAIGYGDKQPIADNATNEGRAANRRITFDWVVAPGQRTSGADG